MNEIRLRLTDEQLEYLQQLTAKAEKAYNIEISLQAVILSAISRGVGGVAYELANVGQERKLRLVK